MVKLRVTTKAGAVIEPMDREQLIRGCIVKPIKIVGSCNINHFYLIAWLLNIGMGGTVGGKDHYIINTRKSASTESFVKMLCYLCIWGRPDLLLMTSPPPTTCPGPHTAQWLGCWLPPLPLRCRKWTHPCPCRLSIQLTDSCSSQQLQPIVSDLKILIDGAEEIFNAVR